MSFLDKLLFKKTRRKQQKLMGNEKDYKEEDFVEEEKYVEEEENPIETEDDYFEKELHRPYDETEDDTVYEVVEREILPDKKVCPDCGGITLEGLEFCDKCGGEL